MASTEVTLPAGSLRAEVTLPALALPGGAAAGQAGEPLPFGPGDLLGRWQIFSVLRRGAQSTLFLAGAQDRADTVIKAYPPGRHTEKAALRRIGALRVESLMPLLGYGEEQGAPYEVMPCFTAGTLEGARITEEQAMRVVIPQLDAALHALHGVRVLHNDVKPANLFWREPGQALALGDFDCITTAGARADSGGTPAYMAPETFFSRGQVHTPASDYCSMGLTLIALLTGRSPLAGQDRAGIALSWQRGVSCPPGLSPRMTLLLNGLVRYDPETRLNHESVQRWLKNENRSGSSIRVEPARAPAQPAAGLRPLYVKDQLVLDIPEMVAALGRDWDYGTFMLAQHQLDGFLIQFSGSYHALCRRCTGMFDSSEALFVLLQSVLPSREFYWRGGHYQSLEEFADQALETGSARPDSPAVHFCRSGMLEFYLKQNGATAEQLKFARHIQALTREDPDLALTQLQVSMNAHPEFQWRGQTFYSLNDLAAWLLALPDGLDEQVEALYRSKKMEAWLDFIGQGTFLPGIRSELEESVG